MTDTLACCPLCHRPVGLLSRRVTTEIRAAEIWRKAGDTHTDIGAATLEPDVVAKKILTRWKKYGLILTILSTAPPAAAFMGHETKCGFKTNLAKEHKT